MLRVILNIHTFVTGVNLATPILLAALGGSLCSQAGVFNIALEGFMLVGAFGGVVGCFFTRNALLGALFGLVCSVLVSLLYGLFCIGFRANQIVVGFGVNMFAIGITGWLLMPIFATKGSFYDPTMPTLPKLGTTFIGKMPVLGRALGSYDVLVYFSWLLAVVLCVYLYKTRHGYRIRATGENPLSLVAIGAKPSLYAYTAVVLSGALCGLAGSHISLSSLAMFTEKMSAGRGSLAVAAVVFSRAHIPTTVLAAFVFGMTTSMAIQMQGIGMPTQLVDMTPYALTILVLLLKSYGIHLKKPVG